MPDQIIDIYFPEKEKEQRRKGIFPTRRDDEILGRRRTGDYINFYDLGCYADGTTVPFPYFDAWGTEKNDITLTHYQTRDDVIFEFPVSQWKNEYKKIDPQRATDYGIQFTTAAEFITLGTDPRFSSAGFKVPSDWWTTNQYMVQAGAWNQTVEEIIIRNGLLTTKVTASYDFDAPNTTCPFSNNMNIYLMPGLKLANGWASGPTVGHLEEINQFFTIVPREHLVATGLLYGTEYFGNYTESGSQTSYAVALESIEWQKIVTDARAQLNGSPMDAADYGALAPAPTPSRAVFQTYNSFDAPSIRIDGTLRVIVEVGGQFYYFWRT